jgi:predicted metal-dependent peptidase
MSQIIITTAETKVRRALDWLVEEFPCFTSVRANWTVIEDNQFDTMATNGKNLYWNRSFVDWMSNEETRWVVLHEAAHVFLGHHFRCLGADKEIRNQALDLAANWLIQHGCPPRLRKMGCFPGQGSFESLPGNQDAEFYLRALQRDQNQDQDQESDESGDSGEQSDDDNTAQASQDAPDQAEEGEEGSPEGDEGENGSQSDSDDSGDNEGQGQPKQFDPDKAGQGEIGEVLEVEEGEEAEQAEQEWQEIVSEGILAAEMAGNLPGWAKEMKAAVSAKNAVRWYHHLKNLMQELGDNGQSYCRPNRKTAWMDIIMPTSLDNSNGRGVILVDTSGSMDAGQMNSALARIGEILQDFPDAEVDMLQCDTRLVGRERTFTAADFPMTIPQEWHGRGGTNMDPAMREISYKKAAKEWAWCIVVSDMYWNVQSAINPGLPTFFVKTSPGSNWYQKPRFGTALEAA